MLCFMMEACKGGLYRLLDYVVLVVIATQIMHGRQGQYSKVFSASWLYCTNRL